MRFRLNELRRIIRKVILEGEEERVYDDTVLPDEEADEELLAEPDLQKQKDRDDYITSREQRRAKKKKARSRSRLETRRDVGDEHSIVGSIGPLGAGNGPGDKPYTKKLKPSSAMPKPIDEYDE